MKIVISLVLILLVASCTTSKKVAYEPSVTFEERILDTMVVVAPRIEPDDFSYSLPVYRESYTRTFDLLHTALDLKFDWENQHVLGKAYLTLKPLFYNQDQLTLDAKGFDIHDIRRIPENQSLQYAYDGQLLTINLNKTYSSSDTVNLFIDYTAKPNEGPSGGSAAITSDKGLFFINPLGKEAGKPRQIWTQGETENNSRWFPTIDKPNERCTQEVSLTVEEEMETLSNGLLIRSEKNKDGTRTDYWKMDIPHAPYLFMLAIGDFAVVRDRWKDIPLAYYVEKKYEKAAEQIFNHTPEMLSFFSSYTGVPYPWPKYDQVVVRDYVSGAMENTTAVIFGEFVQKTKRELIDQHNDDIVAHELFHHWFGNYVTCESWSNLTLNEGFANYSEYLWNEYKYGKDQAGFKRMSELYGYLSSAQNGGTRNLIDFEYDDKENMFDAHSYNKGGLVLHMLRNHIGDEAFRAGMNRYLTQNALSDVEAHELRLAFEEVTGRDLNWFFNQWFFGKGHPELNVRHTYENGVYSIKVIQTQDPENHEPVFQIPVAVDIHLPDTVLREEVILNARTQVFSFELEEKPLLVNFDADNIMLGIVEEELSTAEYKYQYYNAPGFQDRYDALLALQDEPSGKQVFIDALDDPFYILRRMALDEVNPNTDVLIQKITGMALNDAHSEVRAGALNKLKTIEAKGVASLAEKILENELSYPVYANALGILYSYHPEIALSIADSLQASDNYELVSVLSALFADFGSPDYLEYFEKKISGMGGYDSYPVFGNYFVLLQNIPVAELNTNLSFLQETAMNDGNSFKRFMATLTLNNLGNYLLSVAETEKDAAVVNNCNQLASEIGNIIEKIKQTETNEQLLMRYEDF